MDHIEQLKKIRNEAIERMRASKDFKLAGKLGVLIAELGEDAGEPFDYDSRPTASAAAPFADLPSFSPRDGLAEEINDQRVIDELAAEIANDEEIGALVDEAEEEGEEVSPVVLGPFLSPKTDMAEKRPNGASH